jgi:hypothetical protein
MASSSGVIVVPVTWDVWNRAGPDLQAEFRQAVDEYLRRSGEEISEEEEWGMLRAAMLGQHGLLLLAAVDAGPPPQLLGYCLANLLPGTQTTGPILNVWQTYVWPGRARLRELSGRALPLLDAFARGAGVARMTIHTRRLSDAYARVLRGLGFLPYARIYQREVPRP